MFEEMLNKKTIPNIQTMRINDKIGGFACKLFHCFIILYMEI